MLSKRVQVLLEEKEFDRLKSIGKKTHKSIGEIFREAVKLYADRIVGSSQRLLIVEKMGKLNAPVEDWLVMEKEVLRARSR